MPQFSQKFRAGQIQVAQPVSAFIAGRAQHMAYRNDKANERRITEQANQMAYQNSPAYRAQQAQMREAQMGMWNRSGQPAPPKRGTKEVKVGDQFVTYNTVDGAPTTEFARGSRKTGTGADPDLLATPALNQIDKDIVALQSAVGQLDRINPDHIDELLTVQGRVETQIAKVADFFGAASDEQIQRVMSDQALRGTLGLAFQRIRKEVTGAQAAYIELVYLEDAIFAARMSPNQLRAAVQNYREGSVTAINILKNMRSEGIGAPTPDSRQNWGEEFDRRWAMATEGKEWTRATDMVPF